MIDHGWILISLILLLSLGANLCLYLKTKAKPKTANQSEDLRLLMLDLMQGKMGMIGIARIPPEDVLIRSPRDSRR